MDKIIRKPTAILKYFIIIWGFSFLTNYFWESLHSVFLYRNHDLLASKYIPMMLYVASADASIILGIVVLLCLINRSCAWLVELPLGYVSLFATLSLTSATVIELFSTVYVTRWSYRPTMPTVFGIGLSPLIQLCLTGLSSLWLTRRIYYGGRGPETTDTAADKPESLPVE